MLAVYATRQVSRNGRDQSSLEPPLPRPLPRPRPELSSEPEPPWSSVVIVPGGGVTVCTGGGGCGCGCGVVAVRVFFGGCRRAAVLVVVVDGASASPAETGSPCRPTGGCVTRLVAIASAAARRRPAKPAEIQIKRSRIVA